MPELRDFNSPNRSAAMADNGMAATSHPQATLTALDVLRAGGNAVDAALAASAMLCVVEPGMTGAGGDCFVLYAKEGGLPIALNGSGRAPAKADAAWYRERGFNAIPAESPHTVTVPGAVDAWCRIHADHGTKDLAELFAPAIRAAEEGYRITPRVAWDWSENVDRLAGDPHAARAMLPGGKAPKAGDRHSQPALAATLRRITKEGRSAFYEGPVMEEIVKRLKELDGLHEPEDFASQSSEYVEPVHAGYRGYDLYECPPNGQGITALVILRILEGFELANGTYGEADRIHLLAEATKAGYALRDAVVCDPAHGSVPVDELLSDALADRLRSEIRLDRASAPEAWERHAPVHKDTTYLTVVDRDCNAISFINSLFHAFGSCIMAPESGIMLHCRGLGFSTIEGHPNAVAGGKRPMHTIIPAMLAKDGRAQMPFGVMGGQYQATGHAHFLSQILDRGCDPQQAAEAPRHFATEGALQLEPTVSRDVATDLEARGHKVEWVSKPHGGSQAIWIDDERGVLVGGSDPRKDGCALGY